MANDSDPEDVPYDPEENSDDNETFSEPSRKDSDDNETFSEPSRNTKRSRRDFDLDNDSYSSSENIRKKPQLVKKTDDGDNSLKSFKIDSKKCIRRGGIVDIYQCNICYYQTTFQHELKEHFKCCKKTVSKQYWKCPECNAKYTLEDLLDEHSKPADLEAIDQHVFFCPACSYDDRDLKVIILEKVPCKTHKPFICPCCKVRIHGIHIFSKHLSTNHNFTIKYKCEYCEYSSLESESLRNHQKSHANLREMGLVQCSHCQLHFFTMSDIKEHMRRIKLSEGAKERHQIGKKEEKDEGKMEKQFESFVPNELDEETVNTGTMDDEELRISSGVKGCQLQCTLCEYRNYNYSKASCYRHVKNKHRPHGSSIVTFEKYFGDQFKGTVDIGKATDDKVDQQNATQELLKILDCTQSDEDDITKKNASGDVEKNEVITIEVASDSADESETEKNLEDKKLISLQEKKDTKDSAENANKKDNFGCKECKYQTKNKVFLLIHNQLVHKSEEEESDFKCPRPGCVYSSTLKGRFKKHLRKCHKYNKFDIFYSADLKCPDCMYTTKKYHFFLLHRAHAHKSKGGDRNTHKLVYKCEHCPGFSTLYYSNYYRHLKNKHRGQTTVAKAKRASMDFTNNRLTCKDCDQDFKKMYDLAWHRFMSHRDRDEIKKWLLKCKICGYENYSKLLCHQHGLQHKTTRIKFQKFYEGELKGTTSFRYLYHQLAKDYNNKLLKSKFQQNFVETEKYSIKQGEGEITDSEENGNDDQENATQELYKILNSTQSDEENITEKTASTNTENNEVITIEMVSENSEESENNEDNLEDETLNILQKKNKDSVNEEEATLFSTNKKSCHQNKLGIESDKITQNLVESEKDSVKQKYSARQKEGETTNSEEVTSNLNLENIKDTTQLHNPRCTDSGSIKVLDWTQSDDENNIREVGKVAKNKNEFTEIKGLESDDDVLLNMKEEYFTCSKCNYETKDDSYLPLHQMLAHGDPISSEDAKYKCKDCEFESKYRHSLRRHLMNTHKYNVEAFYTKGDGRHKTDINERDVTLQSKNESVEATPLFFLCNSDSEGAKYKCLDCNFESNYRGSLKRHLMNSHQYNVEELYTTDDGLSKTEINELGITSQRKSERDITAQSENESDDATESKNVTPLDTATEKTPLFFLYNSGSKDAKHKCLDCSFESKYRRSLKRHLINSHKYDIEEFYTTDDDQNKTDTDERDITSPQSKSEGDDATEETSLFSLVNSGTKDAKYKCPDCKFESKYKQNFKRHLIRSHCYEAELCRERNKSDTTSPSKTQSKNNADEKCVSQDCPLCSQKYEDKYLRDFHMFNIHGEDTEILKWHVKCSLCSYETYSKKNARKHAAQHNSATESTVVKFLKYYEHKFEGILQYEVEKRKPLRCDKCDYVTKTWECLRRHYKNHKNPNFKYNPLLNRRGNLDLVSDISADLGRSDQENNTEEINSSDETKQNEVIRIEIAPNSDDEAEQSKDSFQNDKRLKPTKENTRTNESSEESTCFNDEKSNCDMEIALESNDEGNQIEDLSQSDECSKQDEEFIEEDRRGYSSSEDSTYISEKSIGNMEIASDSDDETNKTESSKKDAVKADYANVIYVINKCIVPGCRYRSNNKHNLKNHCIMVHNYNRRKLNDIILRMNQYQCPSCTFQGRNLQEMNVHREKKHNEYIGDKTELLKWSIRCTLCRYSTFQIRNARRHAMTKHSSPTESTVVKFYKFYKNKYTESYTCRCGIRKTYRCDKCEFVTVRRDGLQRHLVNHNKESFVPRRQASAREAEYVKKGDKWVKKDSDSAIVEMDKKAGSVSEPYSKQQIFDIIGCSTSEMNEKEENNEDCDSPRNEIQDALDELDEDMEEHETISKIKDSNEVRFSEEDEDKNETSELNPFTGELIIYKKIDLKQIKSSIKSSLERATSRKFKCSSVGCKYVCDSLKEVTDHIKSCSKNNFPKGGMNTKFTCHSCGDILINRNLLKRHCNAHAVSQDDPHLVVSFSEVTNGRHMYDIEIKADLDAAQEPSVDDGGKGTEETKPSITSYKCWMCGVIIFTRQTLRNHTNIHAREDGNLKLKVRYSKFRDDISEGVIIMQGDPNYVFPKKRKRREKSPELDYDPNQPVFSCGECNFKTNEEEALKKHKNLHWTKEKDATFKARKWFTCSVCFFHCFDVETFKKHGEWHKSHSTSTGSIKKLGKDSWFLK